MLLSRFLQHTGHRIGLEINSAKDLGHPQAQYWISHVWPNFFFFFICPRKWEHQSVHTVRAAVLQSAQYSVCRPASSLCVCVCVCVWIRTKADDLPPCLCPSWSPPRSGLLNNSRHTHTQTHATALDTIACVHSRPLVLAHSNRGQQSVPAAIRLNAVGGVDGKMEGVVFKCAVCLVWFGWILYVWSLLLVWFGVFKCGPSSLLLRWPRELYKVISVDISGNTHTKRNPDRQPWPLPGSQRLCRPQGGCFVSVSLVFSCCVCVCVCVCVCLCVCVSVCTHQYFSFHVITCDQFQSVAVCVWVGGDERLSLCLKRQALPPPNRQLVKYQPHSLESWWKLMKAKHFGG